MICELIDLSPDVRLSEQFRDDVILGLLQPRKRIPPKYFYDHRGSELFEEICRQPEYYPTRTEQRIVEDNRDEIAEALGTQTTLIELGSGASVKTRLLLDELADLCAYVPIDISRNFLLESAATLARQYRGLPIIPVCADYTRSLAPLERELGHHSKRTLFFPGSTIGNLEPEETCRFMEQCSDFLTRDCESGKMLIGFDLVKPHAVLNAAYNDAAGATARFNLNLLHRMNRELHADFDVRRFEHRAFFNSELSRVEMHLLSLIHQDVQVAGRTIHFGEEETIHTESSYKYSIESFSRIAVAAGFEISRVWTDPQQYFAVVLMDAQTGVGAMKRTAMILEDRRVAS